MKNIEITDEMLKGATECGVSCKHCPAEKICRSGAYPVANMAREWLAERAERAKNPGVWDGSPEWASEAWIQWRDKTGKTFDDISHAKWKEEPYRRELPKTKAREIAERKALVMIEGRKEMADIIESAILEYQAQSK